jgi:hypothetical protein
MLARAYLMVALLSFGLYGVLWLASSTPYFKDRARVRRILRRSFLITVSVAVTVATLATIITVERH